MILRWDVAQAEQLISVLLHDRAQDIEEAIAAMKSRPGIWKRVAKDVQRITRT